MKTPTNFEKYAREADDKSRDLARRLRDEGRMAAALVRELLKRGAVVSVHDGEDYAIKRSSDRAAILAALFTTDEDFVRARNAAGESLGWFKLIYGNSGEELIADYSDNDFSNAVWEALEPVRTKLAR